MRAVERVVPEPMGGAQHDPKATAQRLGDVISEVLIELDAIPAQERRRQRRERFRRLGRWSDPGQSPGAYSLFGGYSTTLG